MSALDFHHINTSEKEFMITQKANWDIIEPELKKCVILCANCHRALHSGDIQLDAV
jgi:predicted HNH restriction endonuclease